MKHNFYETKHMSLGEKQRVLPLMIADLIVYAYSLGFQLRFDDAFRAPSVTYGKKNSLHKKHLAVDFSLFRFNKQTKRWDYCDKTEDHQLLGEFWEQIGGSWGGRFSDGNHYSIAHEGMK